MSLEADECALCSVEELCAAEVWEEAEEAVGASEAGRVTDAVGALVARGECTCVVDEMEGVTFPS